MVLREHKDPLNTSRGIMGPLENSAGVQNNRGRLKQRFDLIRKLGQGTYGKVQLGIDKETGQEVAIKTIKKSKIETEADLIRIRREIQIMSSVRHPNIIHIYEVFENREKMVLVMEYAAGGELYDYLNERKILQEDEARRIFRQIASAVYYCHKNKICHRDLKLENILLDEKSNAKIADFGLSNVFDDINLLKTFCGSPLYASPEIVKGTPYSGPEVDCWSLGVLLYTLVYGAMPFDGSNFKRLVKQISAGDYYEPKKPAEASPLIRLMLTVDAVTRAKVDDICSHSWINQGFDENCLKSAQDLAKQTPVRLDVLLTLAPNHNVNQSQVVIPSVPENNAAGASNHVEMEQDMNHNHEPMDTGEPPKKPKLKNDMKLEVRDKGKESAVPAKPKRKVQTKTKSKTSPLLNMIQDVVEEEPENDIEMLDQPQQDDDEGDTLSEISEIQTIAEDLEAKAKPKSSKNSDESKPKVSKALKEKAQKAETQPPKPKTETPNAVTDTKNTTEIKVNKEPKIVAASKKEPDTAVVPEVKASVEENKEAPKTVVKKKVVKPKAPTVAETPAEISSEPKKEEVEKAKVTAEKKAEEPSAVTDKATSSSSDAPEEKEGEGAAKSKVKLLRQRSGSMSEASPTQIERRNSKVISQKTAELIQNLETKTSTGPSTTSGKDSSSSIESTRPPGIKKLVIPSFKVSDAKSKFETKPPRPIVSSIMSQSKAAFEAKAQQAASASTAEKKPVVADATKTTKDKNGETPKDTIAPQPQPAKQVKAKSPSPRKESEETSKPEEKPKAKEEVSKVTENDTNKKTTLAPAAETPAKSPAVSPKTKPKVAKKVTEEPKITSPEPPSESTVSTTAPTETETVTKPVEVPKPTVKTPGKIQIPAALQSSSEQEVKPVMIDSGRGALKPVTMVIKGKTTPPPPPVQSPPPSEVTSPTTEANKLLTKLPPQNKEQAAKKISSVINKIVSSGSTDEKKFATLPKNSKLAKQGSSDTEGSATHHKTEVSFPVSAAQSQERVIPIKFEDDTPLSPGAQTPSTAQQTPSGSRTQIPRFPPRLDSFKRFDSSGSMFSRQNSSDTESCSLAPPKPEPIRKSPREFLIPIKLEASGQTVTPKEDVISEATGSEDDFRIDSRLRSGRFGRHKRYSSILSDSSLDEEPSISISAAGSRRPSTTATSQASHARSRSQGDEPETPTSTFKRYRIKRPDLDRSDSFSSAEEDDEDFFEVLTADSLFSNLLDRVRNLTKRLNREGSNGPNWPTASNDPTNFGLWNPSSSLRDLMNRAPSETRTFATTGPGSISMSSHRSFSREPSVNVTINTGPGGWRRSLSRDVSGDSDISGASASMNPQSRNLGGKPGSTELFETTSVRSLPLSLSTRRSSPSSYKSQRSEPLGVGGLVGIGERSEASSTSSLAGRPSLYSGGAGSSTSSRPSYGRTMSNTEYGPGISRTLPFRRSLKTYDRSMSSGVGDYTPSTSGLGVGSTSNSLISSNLDSMIGAVRGLGQSLIDSPATFDPDSYLRQLRSMSRDRESSVSRMSSISEQEPVTSSIAGGVPSSSSNLSIPISSSTPQEVSGQNNHIVNLPPDEPLLSEGKLSVQEKMNNYQKYYQSLTSQNPLSRFQLASPSQIHGTNSSVTSNPNPTGVSNGVGIGLARLTRPNTMYETSFADNNNISQSQLTQPVNHHHSDILTTNANTNSLVSKVEGERNRVSPNAHTSGQLANSYSYERPSPNSVSVTTNLPRPTPTREVPIQVNNNNNATSTSSSVVGVSNSVAASTMTPGSSSALDDRRASLTTSIPKWPNVSIQQYRPLSISSFPDGPRAGSVSRVMSPPPRDDPPNTSSANNTNPTSPGSHPPPPISPPANPISPKKREVRATSVERITRFLERKSVPREVTPGTPAVESKPVERVANTNKEVGDESSERISPEKTGSKLSKPKFIQSLERKWEKLTTSASSGKLSSQPERSQPDENQHQSEVTKVELEKSNYTPAAERPNSEENSIGNEDSKISESVLLRRAVSPEKKPKRFGSGTVNHLLGKFKKFEDNPVSGGLTPSGSIGSKIPSGKPPPGNATSRIGRRVQSVYAGAASDSVLTLPSQPQVRSSPLSKDLPPPAETPNPTPDPALFNGHSSEDSTLPPEPDADLIRTAEIAQQKRRSIRLDTRSSSPAPQPPSSQIPASVSKPQRPVSLGFFSSTSTSSNQDTSPTSSSTKGQSLIPRPNSTIVSNVMLRSSQNPQSLSPPPVTSNPEPITAKSMTPPEITIHEAGSSSVENGSPISPTSISDSVDSSSVCSDKNDPKALSVLDDEESVSDRILRKSFYSRFNSIDRAKRSSSLNSAGAARRNLQPINFSTPRPSSKTSSSVGSIGHSNNSNLTTKGQSVERTLSPTKRESSVAPSPKAKALSPSPTPDHVNGTSGSSSRPKSPSPHSLVINKYNPNPLFKELITDDFKSDIEKKTEYSRRVTSKLSKLLREIESDLNTCHLGKHNGNGGDEDDSELEFTPSVGLAHLNNNHHNYRPTNEILNRRNQLFSRETSIQPEVTSASPEPKDDSMNER